MRDLATPLSIFALAAAIVWSNLPEAQAEPAASNGFACATFNLNKKGLEDANAWLAEQRAAGRTNLDVEHPSYTTLCAW